MRRLLVLRRGSIALAVSALVVGALSAVTLAPTSDASGGWHSFGGEGFGAIPDAAPGGCPAITTPRNVTFAVAGLPAEQLSDVRVSGLTMTHPYLGDVSVTLIAPDGTTQRVLFGRTGATASVGVGDSSDLEGPYTFTDHATPPNGGWWQAAAAIDSAHAVPQGDYFASSQGGDITGGTAASLTGAFAALTDPNGTWTLRFSDSCTPDAGTVTAATLDLRTASAACALEQSDLTFAQGQVAAATTVLSTAQAAQSSAQAGQTAAQTAVATAKGAATKASAGVAKATKALKKALKVKGKKGKAQVKKATRALAKAQAALVKARNAVVAADLALAKAGGPVAAADQAAVNAQSALAGAQGGVTRAQAALTACQQE